MKQWWKTHISRDMLRPIVYKFLARFLYALTAALLWNAYFGSANGARSLQLVFSLICVVFVLGAWLAYLRLGGARLPRLPAKRLRRPKDRPFGDMADYVDEPTTSFSDLTREEQDAALIIADGLNALVYLVLSFLF